MADEIQLIVPETIILQTIESILAFIERDFNANSLDETKSVLYRILNQNIGLQRYKFYEQSKKVFVSAIDNPRRIKANLGFNMQRNGIPTIHVIFPDDRSGVNGINIDEGYQDPVYDPISNLYRVVYSRRFDSNLKIVFTSDNTNEVILAYHLIRAMLIPTINHLSLAGLEQISFSGGDIAINDQLAPLNIYMRELVLNFSYDVNVQNFYDEVYINSLNFVGTLADESNSSSQ